MAMQRSVASIWQRIHLWVQANAPAVLSTLRPGTSMASIASTEQALGITLPDEVRASLQIHDGQIEDEYGGTLGLIDAQELLSLDGILDCWTMWKEAADRGDHAALHAEADTAVRAEWWTPRWIPLTYGVHGSYCVDLSPTQAGTVGQIITVWRDDPQRRVVARSFAAWVDHFASRLEAGEYVLSDDIGGLVPLEDV